MRFREIIINESQVTDDQIETIMDSHYVSVGKKLPSRYTIWRGVGEESGNGMATYGTGLYTTTNKKYASQYGKLQKMDNTALPDFPIRFKTINDYQVWLQNAIKILGYTDQRDFIKDYPDVRLFVNSLLGYDGIQIGTGNDIIFVKYPNKRTDI